MDAYLLDTNVISILYDPRRPKYSEVRSVINSLDPESPQFLSVIVLAELRFGLCMAKINGKDLIHIQSTIALAEERPLAEVGLYTAEAYGEVKAQLAEYWLADLTKQPPRWVEDWVDKASGQTLQIDENDLWLVAQAIERNYVLLTTDTKLRDRFEPAVPDLRLRLI